MKRLQKKKSDDIEPVVVLDNSSGVDDSEDLDFGEVTGEAVAFKDLEDAEQLEDCKTKTRMSVVKKLLITATICVASGVAFFLIYSGLNAYTESMIKAGTERRIENYGYNEDALYSGKYLAVTKEGKDLIIRPKSKKYALDFKDWVNKYYTITNGKLEINEGSLQEYSFEIYFIEDDNAEGWECWLHCEVFRDVIIIRDARDEMSEDDLIKMSTKFIKVIEPQLNK